MSSTFGALTLLIDLLPGATTQQIPYAGVTPASMETDPDFNYDPVSQTLNVPNVSFEDLLVADDILFAKELAHEILVSASTTTNAAGGALSMAAGNGNGNGNGGALSLAGGDSTSGTGGAVAIVGGSSDGETGGGAAVVGGEGIRGGAVSLAGGAGTTLEGGAATLTGGASTSNTGGAVSIAGGASTSGGNGGAVSIQGGDGTVDGAINIGTSKASAITVGQTGVVTRINGNASLGLAALGSSANLCLGFSNAATRPTTSVDQVQLYGVDIAAGAASLGIESEEVVAVDVVAASTHTWRVKINNVTYKILLST